MKNIHFINSIKISAACLVAILACATSCIEEGENETEGKGNNFLRIIAATDGDSKMNKAAASFEAFPSTGQFLEIRRDAVSGADLSEPITVSFVIDNTLVDKYNKYVTDYNAEADEYNKDLDKDDDGIDELQAREHKVKFVSLESERYTLTGTTVTFAPGEFAKSIPMKLDPTGQGTSLGSMDFTASYALGVKITSSPSNYVLTQAGDNVLVQVVVKNKYDGKFKLNVETSGWSAFGISEAKPGDYPSGVSLITAGPKSVNILNLNTGSDLLPGFTTDNASATQFGDASPIFTFDDNDKIVGIANVYEGNSRGRTFALNPNALATENVFDPATKEIRANFLFKQNGRPDCITKWTLTFAEPR